MTDYNEDFPLIDDHKTPKVIKPMTILHDKLVKGYRDERDLKVDKLIVNMQKSISKQISELVQIEDKHQHSMIVLVNCLQHLRDVVDNKKNTDQTLDFINKQCDELVKLSGGTHDTDIDWNNLTFASS